MAVKHTAYGLHKAASYLPLPKSFQARIDLVIMQPALSTLLVGLSALPFICSLLSSWLERYRYNIVSITDANKYWYVPVDHSRRWY